MVEFLLDVSFDTILAYAWKKNAFFNKTDFVSSNPFSYPVYARIRLELFWGGYVKEAGLDSERVGVLGVMLGVQSSQCAARRASCRTSWFYPRWAATSSLCLSPFLFSLSFSFLFSIPQ